MAPGRRTSKAAKTPPKKSGHSAEKSVHDETPRVLSREDVTCKICLDILFRPVTLPCKHTMCYSCFDNCVEKSNLTCPLCRKRISVWARQSRKTNTVVDEKLWAEIQSQFPDLIKAFTEGKSVDTEEVLPATTTHQLAEPGDLRKEYEAEQERIRKAEEERKKQEEIASAELIAQLEKEQAEELARAEELENQRRRDEELALQLAEQENLPVVISQNSTVISTPQSCRKRKSSTEMSKSTSAAKKINSFFSSRLHSTDSDELSSSPSAFAAVTEHLPKVNLSTNHHKLRETFTTLGNETTDLIDGLHFRPINAAPLTPPKNSPGSSTLVKPQVLCGTARNLSKLYEIDDIDSGDVNHNHGEPSGSGLLAEELRELERQWLKKKQEQEEADRAYALKLQEELNQGNVQRTPVNRAKGSSDEYNFRRRSSSSSSKQQKIDESFQRPSRKSAQ